MSDPTALILLVRSRDQVLFNGPIQSLSSTNERGKFDILPLHSNFITLINQELVIELPDGTLREMPVPAGIARVVENEIHVYVGVHAQ